MEAKTINLQIVVNLGNYESVRLGGEWTLNGEGVQEAFASALSELKSSAEELYPKQKKTALTENRDVKSDEAKSDNNQETQKTDSNERQLVTFEHDNALLQKIVTKISRVRTVTIENVLEHYDFDEDARKCIDAAFKLR